ncbi:MAG: hypothetical protein FWE88_09220 [Phycisphaerae bacterium]|nr:hypothetical protein [Phycisphaerae bacterium]
MIIATHIILSGYGHWLPNDLRGSHSKTVFAPRIAELGSLHAGAKATPPPVVALREFHKQARTALTFSVHWFSPEERAAIRDAFAQLHQEHRLTSYACAILPDHIHLLVRRHFLNAKKIHALLKECASEAVRRCGLFTRGTSRFQHGSGDFFQRHSVAGA